MKKKILFKSSMPTWTFL